MRRIWWYALLAASLCLNAGFLSAVLVHAVRHGHTRSMPDLNLSPMVKTEFDANYAAFQKKMAPLRAELREDRAQMFALLASDHPTPEAIRSQEDKILAVTARLLQTASAHMLDQKRLLSAEQQRRFFDFIQHHNPDENRRPPSPLEEKHP